MRHLQTPFGAASLLRRAATDIGTLPHASCLEVLICEPLGGLGSRAVEAQSFGFSTSRSAFVPIRRGWADDLCRFGRKCSPVRS